MVWWPMVTGRQAVEEGSNGRTKLNLTEGREKRVVRSQLEK